MNYVNEHEFVLSIKSGGYGKVYMGKNTFIIISIKNNQWI